MLRRLLTIDPNQVLLVKGPATIRAKEAKLSSLGVTLPLDQPVLVRSNRTMPFEADQRCAVHVTIGSRGDYRVRSGRLGVKIWEPAAERILQSELLNRKVMIIGETDSGKSTLATYLLNRAISLGLKVGLIDGDIGQSDICPPGSVGSALVEEKVFDLRDVKADYVAFVGATSPRGVSWLVVNQIADVMRMIEERSPDLYLINTDGYIAEEGVDYKVKMIEQLAPDLILCISGEDSLYSEVERKAGNYNVARLDPPEKIPKSKTDRLNRRLSQYRRFLQNGIRKVYDLRLLKLRFLNDTYFYDASSHASVPWRSALYAGKTSSGNELLISAESLAGIQFFKDTVVFSRGSFAGMFVGLGLGSSLSGFGLVQRIGYNFGVSILSSVSLFDTVFPSSIILSHEVTQESAIPIISS